MGPQEAFGRLVLQGTFEATLAIAALLSMERQCRTKVLLGGAETYVHTHTYVYIYILD